MSKHHETLGVGPNASEREIKKAFHALARRWHPDHHTEEGARREAEENFKRINAAYRALVDEGVEEKKAAPRRRPKRAARSAEPKKRRNILPAALAFAAVLAVAGILYVVGWFAENSDKITVGGATLRPWEWQQGVRIGATKDEVIAVQGRPLSINEDLWRYGGSDWVHFSDGRVDDFSNDDGTLRLAQS